MKGQSFGISWHYLRILAGVQDVKADWMICAFVEHALGRTVNPAEAREIVTPRSSVFAATTRRSTSTPWTTRSGPTSEVENCGSSESDRRRFGRGWEKGDESTAALRTPSAVAPEGSASRKPRSGHKLCVWNREGVSCGRALEAGRITPGQTLRETHH